MRPSAVVTLSVLVFAIVLAGAPARAQTGNAQTQQPPGPPPGMPAPPPQPGIGQNDRSVPEQIAPGQMSPGQMSPGLGAGTGGGTVGSSGVIRPPAQVDPGINKTPPAAVGKTYNTPVVPPPGAPGGNTQVVPK
jgi:hypothetical protein